jgi:hypothetical protein
LDKLLGEAAGAGGPTGGAGPEKPERKADPDGKDEDGDDSK